jgi:copper(I)-binding protein
MNRTNACHGIALALVAAAGSLLALPAAAEVVVTEAWARATVPGTKVGAGYLVMTNKGSEESKLLKIVSPACDIVSLHRTTVDANGVARMWPVAKLEIAPGQSVRFEPSGLHLMFEGLVAPFVAGGKVPLRLQFEGEKEITVELVVKPLVPDAPARPASPHGHPDR